MLHLSEKDACYGNLKLGGFTQEAKEKIYANFFFFFFFFFFCFLRDFLHGEPLFNAFFSVFFFSFFFFFLGGGGGYAQIMHKF